MKKNQKKTLNLCALLLFLLPSISWGQIKVYTMDGCGRCSWTIRYLKANNIPFTEVNTSKSEKNNIEMWELLAKNNAANGSVTMPVIDNNGVVAHSIPDLDAYLAKLNTKDNNTTDSKSEIMEEKKTTRKKKRIPSKLKKNG